VRPSLRLTKHGLSAALKRLPENARIAIELTGGKPALGGALAIATEMLDRNIDLLYVDYRKYMPQIQKPEPKSTYIHLISNRMKLSADLFGSREIKRAVDFFNVGKYENSKVLFEDISIRMANPRATQFCARLSQFYLQWDTFAFKDALEQVSFLSEHISSFQNQILSRFSVNLEHLQKQSSTRQSRMNEW